MPISETQGSAMSKQEDTFDIEAVYKDLHANPELSFQEHRTAKIVADHLEKLGYQVTTGIGRTGVVGVMERGEGPTVMLRADMDALPVEEETGLPYASTKKGLRTDGSETPVMHACGHDVHTTCLMGAALRLAEDPTWTGKLMLVFQPAEEVGQGALEMVKDGIFERLGTPDIVLGQHVSPLPAGFFGVHPGPAFAASDSLHIELYGKGGHGSRPETTQDPVLMAANFVVRLQDIVSRNIAATDMAVVTVGALNAGTKGNIIPDHAELELSVRTFEPEVRDKVLETIERYAKAEALAVGAEMEPLIETNYSFPAVVNNPEACAELTTLLESIPAKVVDIGSVTGSEDVGIFALEADAPCCYWLLGGSDPALFKDARSLKDFQEIVAGLPSNHSPMYAPVIQPTLKYGVDALVLAAKHWLGQPA